MKAFILRGQGLGLVTDKVFLQWPSAADVESVMARELELHGFDDVDGVLVPCPRWVRVQAVDIVDVAADVPADGKENELLYGKLSDDAAAHVLSNIAAGGDGNVAASGDIIGQGTAVVGT